MLASICQLSSTLIFSSLFSSYFPIHSPCCNVSWTSSKTKANGRRRRRRIIFVWRHFTHLLLQTCAILVNRITHITIFQSFAVIFACLACCSGTKFQLSLNSHSRDRHTRSKHAHTVTHTHTHHKHTCAHLTTDFGYSFCFPSSCPLFTALTPLFVLEERRLFDFFYLFVL